jgi:hypothetical protein
MKYSAVKVVIYMGHALFVLQSLPKTQGDHEVHSVMHFPARWRRKAHVIPRLCKTKLKELYSPCGNWLLGCYGKCECIMIQVLKYLLEQSRSPSIPLVPLYSVMNKSINQLRNIVNYLE